MGRKTESAAEKYGEIIDSDFPNVSPEWSEEELYQLADQECGKILDLLKGNPDSAVLCQGECALNFLIVKFLLDEGVKVVTAVTERDVDEVRKGEVIEKRSKFVFSKIQSLRQQKASDQRAGDLSVCPEKEWKGRSGYYSDYGYGGWRISDNSL